MAKRGGTKHLKRITTERIVPIHNKKLYTWIIQSNPGPHTNKSSMPLRVLMREVLGVARTAKEVSSILNNRLVSIDGTIRTEGAFPVGLMDVIAFSKSNKQYQLVINPKGQLTPREIQKNSESKKFLKVIGKNTIKKGKINLTLHDGTNVVADNNVLVGDTILFDTHKKKLEKVLKLEVGAMCLITEGKHAGVLAHIKELIERKEGRSTEARLESKEAGEFITIADYLFVVDKEFTLGDVHG